MTAAIEGSALLALVASRLGDDRAGELLGGMELHPEVLVPAGPAVPRAVLAQALGAVLLDDVVARVPSAAAYVADRWAEGGTVFLDHGAVRTVEGVHCGDLPPGQEALARGLSALGYSQQFTYDLASLGMTGRSWCHADLPAAVPQYFVSELHAGRFSPSFQEAAARVVGSSVDPVTPEAQADLNRLSENGSLPMDRAVAVLAVLVACFARQHGDPAEDDYEALLAESAEMAWIATEGTVFNHATDRVPDVLAVAQAERAAGRPIKDEVEVSGTGRILQTAYRAALVERTFLRADGSTVRRQVPGSFFELITRRPKPDGSGPDLAFDAANAQKIFSMTRTAAAAAPGA